MRYSWLKFAIAAAAISLPMAAQNNQLFSQKPASAPSSPAKEATPAAKATNHAARGRHGKPKKVEVAKEPELPPPPPPPPPTPEQMPAKPPQVSYLNGQLTIQSTNATLSSILNAVRQQTGAQIDMPPGSGNERVATRVGPGPARDVIASLLNGSAFDFLILGAPDSPGGVKRIILTAKGATGSSNMTGMAQRPAPAAQPEPDENNSEEEQQAEVPETPPEPPQPAAEAAPNTPVQSGQPQPGASTPEQPQSQSSDHPANTGPKVSTPEQLLQQLQNMKPKQ